MLAVALVAWAIVIVLGVRSYRAVSAQYRSNQVVHITLAQAATLPFIAAGIILLSGSSSGLYLVVPGTIFAYVVAVFNAWVLLIEINR